MKKPLLLMILDGWGVAPASRTNAVTTANTPNLDELFRTCPHALMNCSGEHVGLPDGQMGNSEVGHTNIGAGRIVYQELTRITKDIRDYSFFENPTLLEAVEHAKQTGGTVHLMGLLSDGGVHSHLIHLFALIDLCEKHKVKTCIHSFLDGRDTPPESGADFVRRLELRLAETANDKVRMGVICGRFYAMDRDKRWERLQKAYDALVEGKAHTVKKGSKAVEESYKNGVTDEFMEPVRVEGARRIESRDSVIFYNFRPDRAREITRALCDDAFDGFHRSGGTVKPHFVCFTQYDASMPNVEVAFKPQKLDNIFGQYIAEKGLTQLRIAETEKYAHVTFFFNGGEERTFDGEDRALIASPKVATYDLQPEMSAYEVADECVARIESGKYDVIILNFANCDMVGHTGVMDAAVKAVEAVDTCVGKVIGAVRKMGGTALITADHGNAECMEENGVPFTQHTVGQVPVILVDGGDTIADGALCDLAPTMLKLLGLEQPAEMTGKALV
ncbi:MAG: 2,3-bisphosphoglycerate-independent phosphoglycerate mutase [Clostridia bacterium]|nr:2,3-bisphosphoglycerate-independent phosphoglycerate mutase [Clostridia bacterium]